MSGLLWVPLQLNRQLPPFQTLWEGRMLLDVALIREKTPSLPT